MKQRILSLEMNLSGLTPKSERVWQGISRYYALLLQESDLEQFDACLTRRLQAIACDKAKPFTSKTALQNALGSIHFLSHRYQSRRKQYINEIVDDFSATKNEQRLSDDNKKNQKLIQQRKKEFRKLEAETSGLLVNRPGTYIGLTQRGVTVSEKGKVIVQYHPENLSQIIVTGKGVSMSSNLINYCLGRKIPIDFFDHHGVHLGSVTNSSYMQCTLWKKQAEAVDSLKRTIALAIIEGKIKNQQALLKYFHKYHKKQDPLLNEKLLGVQEISDSFRGWKKQADKAPADFMNKLLGYESQMAIKYWDYIRQLISDDGVGFERREHQGATDLFNSMLNYGYAILYVRVWQSLLAARLNPFESLIHVRQDGKPTLVYDVVELFRSQVVDRIVISLIQKGQELEVRNGMLTDKTRQLLVKSVMERMARYEKYQGEEMKMEQIIMRQAKLLAKTFSGEAKFKPYVAKW